MRILPGYATGMTEPAPRSHLWPMNADTIAVEDAPFVFVTFGDLEAERRALQAALPVRAEPQTPPPTTDTGFQLGWRLGRLLRSGRPPPPDELTDALAQLTEAESRSLDRRLNQIRNAIAYGRRVRGRDYDPTPIAVVSHRWDRRWVTLVSGTLYPAYVGFLSVAPFSS